MAGCARLAVPDAAAGAASRWSGPLRPPSRPSRSTTTTPTASRSPASARPTRSIAATPCSSRPSPARRHHRSALSVPAATPGTNPAWFVFALRNVTDKPIERWLTADRYGTVGLRRGVARPRRAAHRARHAVGRLRARAHQERPRRRVPPHAGAGPDRHLRRRACRRPASRASICGRPSSTSRRAATASSSTASCWASPACSPSS